MDRRLTARIDGQLGLVTRTQALAFGLSDKAVRWKVDSGRWVRVHPGVYLTVPGRDDGQVRALAVLLHIGTPSALCRAGAAYLWRPARAPGPTLEVVVGASQNPGPIEGVVVRRSKHAIERTHETAWPHRTTVEQTILDLGLGEPLDVAVGLIARADQPGLTTARNLRQALDHRPTQTSRSLPYDVIGDVQGGAESSAERRYIRDVEIARALPRGRRQAAGRGGTRRDNVYHEIKVIVEIDGRRAHAGWRAQQRDGRRDRQAAADAYLTVRGFWPDVAGGRCGFALELKAIFRSRGWKGRVRPCRSPGCAVKGGL